MSRTTIKQVLCSSDTDERPTIGLKDGRSGRRRRKRRAVIGMFRLRLVKSSFSPARLLRRFGMKLARALRFVSIRRKSSHKVSSSNLPRSRSLAESIDSHHAEAIEDCIEFLNSSSSLSRSNSVSTCSC
ncbi:Sulfoquinovosyldiacylglycerol 2 [Hibiscus syriacus]|uniref:Sulfoquinovosyldiacylglycerol 2 n=1 Tax=Hibiscus syriacus TaxID=106335 RepID=A0A6A3BRB4_HIBSY|nr:josephin-like protein [Hibiscus syriacus]KAE8719446.1 Sulfoquinovosyldiacylglycerol 2 [Hibiscus syriacus]